MEEDDDVVDGALAELAEDVDAHRRSLQDVVREVADLVCARDAVGKQYGVVLIPEGLIGSIPEIAVLPTIGVCVDEGLCVALDLCIHGGGMCVWRSVIMVMCVVMMCVRLECVSGAACVVVYVWL